MSEQTGNKGEEKESLLVGFNGGNCMKQNYNLNENETEHVHVCSTK